MRIVSNNRKALYNYEIQDEIEVGIVLAGNEVKSIREGRVSISDAFITIIGDEAYIINMDIPYFRHSFKELINKYNPRRNRKLLLHKHQIHKIIGKLKKSGQTIVCTSIYWNKNKIKLKIALAKGKKMFDKRREIKKKDEEMDARRERNDEV